MKIKHLFVSILLATGFQPMIAQSALQRQTSNTRKSRDELPVRMNLQTVAVKRIVLSSLGIRLPAIWIQTDVYSSLFFFYLARTLYI